MTGTQHEITIGMNDRITINTPSGEITIFHGSHYRTMTCFAKNLEIAAFYDKGATKKTRKPFMEGSPRLVILNPKKEK